MGIFIFFFGGGGQKYYLSLFQLDWNARTSNCYFKRDKYFLFVYKIGTYCVRVIVCDCDVGMNINT